MIIKNKEGVDISTEYCVVELDSYGTTYFIVFDSEKSALGFKNDYYSNIGWDTDVVDLKVTGNIRKILKQRFQTVTNNLEASIVPKAVGWMGIIRPVDIEAKAEGSW